MTSADSTVNRVSTTSNVRKLSFRRKTNRESVLTYSSTWNFNRDNKEWHLLRGNYIVSLSVINHYVIISDFFN